MKDFIGMDSPNRPEDKHDEVICFMLFAFDRRIEDGSGGSDDYMGSFDSFPEAYAAFYGMDEAGVEEAVWHYGRIVVLVNDDVQGLVVLKQVAHYDTSELDVPDFNQWVITDSAYLE
jgi:hypothetical protein